ncbi:hypothetical protein WA158_007752 [Blastocystis sp. Blastoise]
MNAQFQIFEEHPKAHEDAIWCSTFDKDGHLITGSVDETMKVWGSDYKIISSNPHQLSIVSVAAHPKEDIIATSSMDGNIRFYSLSESKVIKVLSVGPTELWSLAFTPDGTGIATKPFIFCIAFSDDGNYIATSHSDGSVNIYNAKTYKLITTIKQHNLPCRVLRFSHDSTVLFTGSNDMQINAIDLTAGGNYQLLYSLQGHMGWIFGLDITNDGLYLATASSDKTVKIWDLTTKTCIQTFTSSSPCWSTCFSRDGSRLVFTCEDGSFTALIRKSTN